MNKRKLVEDYIGGWIDGNRSKIINSLTDDCVIIESHGPTYVGKELISKWIEEWVKEGRINKWEITSYYESEDSAFFEWNFICKFKGKKHEIEGVSLVKFEEGKISFIREYRTTNLRFIWK